MAKLLPLLAAFLFPTIIQRPRDHFHKVLPAAEEGLVTDVCVCCCLDESYCALPYS